MQKPEIVQFLPRNDYIFAILYAFDDHNCTRIARVLPINISKRKLQFELEYLMIDWSSLVSNQTPFSFLPLGYNRPAKIQILFFFCIQFLIELFFSFKYLLNKQTNKQTNNQTNNQTKKERK